MEERCAYTYAVDTLKKNDVLPGLLLLNDILSPSHPTPCHSGKYPDGWLPTDQLVRDDRPHGQTLMIPPVFSSDLNLLVAVKKQAVKIDTAAGKHCWGSQTPHCS